MHITPNESISLRVFGLLLNQLQIGGSFSIFESITPGEVQERLNWPPWKGGILVRVSWVRIPPSPPIFDFPASLLHESAHLLLYVHIMPILQEPQAKVV